MIGLHYNTQSGKTPNDNTLMNSTRQQIRVHIVGCPRSGTTLMTELMRYAYQFAGAADHEQTLFAPIPADLSPYLSKKPADTIRIGHAFEKDENLHVIALIRDPRAVITSKHWSHPDMYFVGFARWRHYADVIARYQNHPRYLLIRYEDLLHDPDGQQQRVNQHLPFLQQERVFSAYPEGVESLHNHAEKALGGVRPFDTSRINAWQEHLGRIKREQLANADFQQALEQFGYETDDSWLSCLQDVEPAGSSYKDRTEAWPKSWEIGIRYWWRTRRYLAARGR